MKDRYSIQQKIKIIALFSIAVILSACSASVRFTTDNKPEAKKNNIAKNSKANSADKSHAKKRENRTNTEFGNIERGGARESIYSNSYENDDIVKYSSEKPKGIRKMIIEEAQTWIGTPYCWGGESRAGADCSGFVMEVYKKAGIILPRTAADQYTLGNNIDLADAKTGDLVFFSKGDRISHVGIYLGDNNILHSSLSRGVVIQSLSTMGMNPVFAGCKAIIK